MNQLVNNTQDNYDNYTHDDNSDLLIEEKVHQQVEGSDGAILEIQQTRGTPRVNKCKLHLLCFCLGMFFIQIGWVIAGNNQPSDVIRVQLGNPDDDTWTTQNAFISASSVLGMTIGALIAGAVVAHGRRKFLIIFGVVGILFTGLTLFANLYLIVAGRFMHGLATGVFMTGGPRILDETVPSHLLGTFGTYTNVYANLGIMLVMVLGFGLPSLSPGDDAEKAAQYRHDLEDDQFWRVIYGFPIITLTIGVVMLLTVFRQDSIVFLVTNNKKEEAIEMISQIYYGDAEEHNRIYEQIKANTKVEASAVTVVQALTDPQYRKATWICFVLAVFNQNTGLNAIMMYSNIMISKLNEPGCADTPDGCFFLSPVNATVFLGITGFVGALFGPLVIGSMKRKMNMLYGHGMMGITMMAMAIFKMNNNNIPLFICICLYAVLYQTSLGAAIWMYSNEVTVDAAGGLIVIGVFGTLFIHSLTLQQLMDSALKPEGVFIVFGVFTIIGFFYVLFFIKDTWNLTDKQKKQLYNS